MLWCLRPRAGQAGLQCPPRPQPRKPQPAACGIAPLATRATAAVYSAVGTAPGALPANRAVKDTSGGRWVSGTRSTSHTVCAERSSRAAMRRLQPPPQRRAEAARYVERQCCFPEPNECTCSTRRSRGWGLSALAVRTAARARRSSAWNEHWWPFSASAVARLPRTAVRMKNWWLPPGAGSKNQGVGARPSWGAAAEHQCEAVRKAAQAGRLGGVRASADRVTAPGAPSASSAIHMEAKGSPPRLSRDGPSRLPALHGWAARWTAAVAAGTHRGRLGQVSAGC